MTGRTIFTNCLVSGMGQIGVAALFVGEGHDEAVRETLRLHLGAVVGAGFEVLDDVDLLGQLREGVDDFLDLCPSGRRP